MSEEVTLQVDAGKILHRIDEKVYGHFLEHIYHSCNGGLWGDLVWNRSFEQRQGGYRIMKDGVLTQETSEINALEFLSNDDQTDYEISVEARKIAGAEGFIIPVRYKNKDEFHWINLGGWQNSRHGIERKLAEEPRQSIIGDSVPGAIETDRWYEIKVRCEGKKITVHLDGQKILENEDEKNLASGNVGVGVWATESEFRNFKIDNLASSKNVAEIDGAFWFDKSTPSHWETYGDATSTLQEGETLNDSTLLKIVGASGGILQKNFNIKKGETYEGSLWVSDCDVNRLRESLAVSFDDLAENIVHWPTTLRTLQRGKRLWTEIPLRFTADKDVYPATLRIALNQQDSFSLDQVSLMPKSWKEDYSGLRPDLLQAVADLKPPVIRWPGGCYASPYRWKTGIGPQEERRSIPRIMWDDQDPNSFGTDEFMELCRRVGAEPLLVVNMGSAPWYPAGTDRSEFVRDIFDWIEYCNGPADSTWGKIRAKNGHPEPYNVKYWELDNETWGWGVENYAAAVNEIAPLIRKKYPDLVLIACGSAGHGNHPDGFPWNQYLVEHCAENFDVLSIHMYENPDLFDSGARAYEAFIAGHRDMIAQSKNPGLKIYCSEWNAQSTDWRTGLYCGCILNGFERVGDIFTIGGPALFLRHVSATEWDNAFVNFDNATWFPAPNYVVMKLYRDHFAPNLLELSGDQKGLNCTPTKSDDGKTVYIKAVNPTDTERSVKITFHDFVAKKADFKLIEAEGLNDRNTLEEPGKISPKPGKISVRDGAILFTLPPYTVGVVGVQ